MLEVKGGAADSQRREAHRGDHEPGAEQSDRVADAMAWTRADDHRGGVVLQRRDRTTEHTGERRARGLEPDRGHGPQQRDPPALAGADVREDRREIHGDQPEHRRGHRMPGRDHPIQDEQTGEQAGSVDGGPDLDRHRFREERDRGGEERHGRRADERVDGPRRCDDVADREVLRGRVVHVRGVGQVGVRALPHTFRIGPIRVEDRQHDDPDREYGGERPVQRRPRQQVGGRSTHGAYDIALMATRKPKSLTPVRRTMPELHRVEAPDRTAATVSEQKINQYRKRRYQALHADTDAANKRRAAGKATARDRIEMLLDEGSFVELDVFATNRAHGFGMEEKRVAGDGVVAGFGEVDGRPVAVYAYDATVFGGSLGEVTAEKILKVQELALRNRVPIIGINDSGGARIQEGVVALAGYADIFFRNVRSSGVIPQLSVIAGPCTGGAVYSPAITDFIFIVAGQGYMFITGPEVIKVVTGEAVSFDELGGGHVHNATSGVAHFLPRTEQECAAGVRKLLSYLPSSNNERPPFVPTTDDLERADAELQTIVPESPNKPYDMRQVVSRVLDGREFFEVQPFFAPNIIVGLGRLGGHVVGIVGNQPKVLAGAIDINASVKAARFIRFCDAFGIPIISFVDVPGYLPGRDQEHGGIIRHGAKLLYAYAEATVPKLAVITRKNYGGAYCVMSPKQMGADLNLAWPTAEIAVLGPDAAVNIIYKRDLTNASDPAARRQQLVAEYTTRFANPYVAAERGYIDDVIEPRETRRALVRGLELCLRKTVERPPRKHGNIPL